MSLKDTLKYIKENNLYKRKGTTAVPEPQKPKRTRRTKEGGVLIDERAEAQLQGDVKAEPRATGGVPSMKLSKPRPRRVEAIV